MISTRLSRRVTAMRANSRTMVDTPSPWGPTNSIDLSGVSAGDSRYSDKGRASLLQGLRQRWDMHCCMAPCFFFSAGFSSCSVVSFTVDSICRTNRSYLSAPVPVLQRSCSCRLSSFLLSGHLSREGKTILSPSLITLTFAMPDCSATPVSSVCGLHFRRYA